MILVNNLFILLLVLGRGQKQVIVVLFSEVTQGNMHAAQTGLVLKTDCNKHLAALYKICIEL